NVPDPLHPANLIPNPGFNSSLQSSLLNNEGGQVFNQGIYSSYNTATAGIVPQRTPLSSGAYTDGSATLYVANGTGGTSTIAGGGLLAQRDKLEGDFNGGGVRDINDTADLIAAYKRYQGTGAWSAPDGVYGAGAGADFSIDLMGDFNNDGSFDRED